MQNVMYSIFDVTGIFDFGKMFIAIIMLPIVYKAEDIVRSIFGLQTRNLQTAAAMSVLMLSQAKKIKGSANKLKEAKGKFAASHSVDKPDKINPNSNSNDSSNVANNNMQEATNQTNTGETGSEENKKKEHRFAKGLGKVAAGKGELSNKLASKVMGMALGYGISGDYQGAIAGKSIQENVRNKVKTAGYNIRTKLNVAEKEEGMLDAYEDFKENRGLSDLEMYDLSKDLLDKDINDIEDDLEKQYAEWLHSVRDTEAAMSSKENEEEAMKAGKAHVVEMLQKHILK